MKFLPGRIAWKDGDCTQGAWRALLLLRIELLPGRIALKTLDPMTLCTDSLSSSLLWRNSFLLLECSRCLEICRELLDLICKFSLLKRCSYSLYSDTMLNIGYVLNETNADVRMYIEEFILVEIWIHYCTSWNLNMKWSDYIGKYTGIYTHTTIAWAKWEMLLEVNWQGRVHRITIVWETVNCEN